MGCSRLVQIGGVKERGRRCQKPDDVSREALSSTDVQGANARAISSDCSHPVRTASLISLSREAALIKFGEVPERRKSSAIHV